MKSTIENSLKIRLINLNISNSNQLIGILIDELKKNQSLITIAGV
jgi:hypothetical protein